MSFETTSTPLHVERTGTKTYTGRNDRGAEVRIGAPGANNVFTPGELLQLALGACGLLSADHTLASELGDAFAARVDIAGAKNAAGDRYETINANVLANLAALDEDKRAALIDRARRAIDRQCTISHTLEHGLQPDIALTNAPSLPQHRA